MTPAPDIAADPRLDRARAAADWFLGLKDDGTPRHPVAPHPMEFWYPDREALARAILNRGLDAVQRLWAEREARIRRAQDFDPRINPSGDPFTSTYEPGAWGAKDKILRVCEEGLYDSGGKRSTKTNYGVLRALRAAEAFPGAYIWMFAANKNQSVTLQQRLVWKYFPASWRALNGPRNRKTRARINYDEATGFVQGQNQAILIAPNGSTIQFLTYEMDPKGFMGFKLGVQLTPELRRLMDARPDLHNIGAFCDEAMTLDWFREIKRRCSDYNAKILWAYSPEGGITPTIRELVQGAETLVHERATHLPAEVKHHPHCPPGHMPVVQRTANGQFHIFYSWTEFNPFGDFAANYARSVRSADLVTRRRELYGYCEDVIARAWPSFNSEFHILNPSHLPDESRFARRTNCQVVDIAETRQWSSLWFGVLPSGVHVITDDWPDAQTYGPWAVPSANPNKYDGDPGPAQAKAIDDTGWVGLKRAWQRVETVLIPPSLLRFQSDRRFIPIDPAKDEGVARLIRENIPDPHRRWLVWRALRKGQPLTEPVVMTVDLRFIDPRAAVAEQMAEEGGTCALWELAREHTGADGRTYPGLDFIPAKTGKMETNGITQLDSMLQFDRNIDPRPVPLKNEPQVYVWKSAQQVIDCLAVFTGHDGPKGAWKDFADKLRMMALASVDYFDPEGPQQSGGGAY